MSLSSCRLKVSHSQLTAVFRPALRPQPSSSGSPRLTTLVLMSTAPPSRMQAHLVAYFRSGDVMRSRSVSKVVLSGALDVPAIPAALVADWEREISLHLELEPGDVEALPLVRARARWTDYRRCVQAVADWAQSLGLHEELASSEAALMACRGARYHHDGAQYGGAAFCNLFLSEDKGLDLHFPAADLRIPLRRGTVVIFDTGQPHAVIERGGPGFDAADFPAGRDCSLVFLTWELPIENTAVGQALGISFDTDPGAALLLADEQVFVNGAPASVCPASGRWRRAD